MPCLVDELYKAQWYLRLALINIIIVKVYIAAFEGCIIGTAHILCVGFSVETYLK